MKGAQREVGVVCMMCSAWLFFRQIVFRILADSGKGLFRQHCEIGAEVADGVRVVAESNDLPALSAGTVVSNQQQIGGGKGSKGQPARLV